MRFTPSGKHCPDYAARVLADKSLRKHEGLRLFPYWDTASPPRITIGYGRNLEDKGITEAEAEILLAHDIEEAIQDVSKFSFWSHLSQTRKAALINMRFQLGPSGIRKFKKMLAALHELDFVKAANEMLYSQWAKQTPGRAREVSQMMRKG